MLYKVKYLTKEVTTKVNDKNNVESNIWYTDIDISKIKNELQKRINDRNKMKQVNVIITDIKMVKGHL